MSDMNDKIQRLTSRIAHVENDIKQIKEAVLNKSLQFAVEGIQNTLNGLVYTLKEADYMRTEVTYFCMQTYLLLIIILNHTL